MSRSLCGDLVAHRLLVERLLLRQGGRELPVLVAEAGQIRLNVPELVVRLGELRRAGGGEMSRRRW